MFGAVPEHLKPKCENIDDRGVCPKGVPVVLGRNFYAHEIFAVIVGSAGFVEPEIGLVRFDAGFVRDYVAVLATDEFEKQVLFLKTLLLVSAYNERILELREKRTANADFNKTSK